MIPAAASAVFLVTIALILTERVHRMVAAAAGAVVMLIVGHAMGFYTEAQAISAIDFETLGLLLGMMILVRLIGPTGFFEYMAIVAARKSGAQPWRLLVLLGATTTLMSLVLDNVTTVLFMAPLTVLVAELVGLSPVPLLIAEALLSNTGGVATLIGDPPNVLIGSAAGLSFTSFLTHLAPIVLVAWAAALATMRWLFRRELAAGAAHVEALEGMSATDAIHDSDNLRRLLVVLAGTVAVFFIQGRLGVSPALVALTGAAVAMVWVHPDVNELLSGVEWSVLLFFAGLFVAVGGLEAAGVLHEISLLLESAAGADPMLLGIALMWAVAALSALVDNVPVTIAAIPIVAELEAGGMNASSLWWALALGAGLGGNGTIVGSTANIVVVSVSERTRTPITARGWIRAGLPVMVVTLVVATVLYAAAFGWMSTR